LFAYREFYKNLLAILDEVSLRIYGEKSNIPNRFCEHFGLHDDDRIHEHLMKLSNITTSDPEVSYETVMNSQPHQLSLRNMPTVSSITDSVDESWDKRKISRYFNERNNIVNQQEEVPMTASKQFEQAYIIFSTMKIIKLTTKKGKGKLFTIECCMPSFEPQNESVCK
jgi:hypothetical protein